MRKNVLCPYCRHERRGKPIRFHSLRQGLEKELLRAPLEMRRKAQGDITRLLATPAMMAADLGGEAPRTKSVYEQLVRRLHPPYFDFILFQKGMVDLRGRLKKFDKQSTRHREHRDVFSARCEAIATSMSRFRHRPSTMAIKS